MGRIMKKILLTIILIMAIFQLVVLATAIDMGWEGYYTGSRMSPGNTIINLFNPANETGKITTVKIYADKNYADLTNCTVATFYAIDATHYTTRDYEMVDNGNGAGVVIKGSLQTFTVDLNVVGGDFIGIYYEGGRISWSGETGGGRYTSGDHIPCDNYEFLATADIKFALYGLGETEEAPAAGINIMFIFSNF